MSASSTDGSAASVVSATLLEGADEAGVVGCECWLMSCWLVPESLLVPGRDGVIPVNLKLSPLPRERFHFDGQKLIVHL